MEKLSSIIACLAGVLAIGFGMFMRGDRAAASIAVIGGADGPTSVFVAGKVGHGSVTLLFAVGAVLLVLAVVLFFKHHE